MMRETNESSKQGVLHCVLFFKGGLNDNDYHLINQLL